MTTPPALYDVVLAGGTVLDPGSGLRADADVAVSGSTIAAIGTGLAASSARVVDCTGAWVTPGLVDGHTHVFTYASLLGADPVEAHLRRGVVACADAGTAGASTFAAFKELVVDRSPMRVVSFLNVSALGLVDFRFGELLNPATLSADDAVATALANPETVRGFKIRLSTDVVGARGLALLDQSVALADEAGLPLMVHIGETEATLPVIMDRLRPGDIVSHCYTGKEHGILGDGGVLAEVRAARARGVVFDAAHGKSNLAFRVAAEAIADGFLPDVVSSDTSARNWHGPVFDLLTSMSKLIALGVAFEDVLVRATANPARLLGLDAEGFGSLRVGGPAHVTVVRETGPSRFVDAEGDVLEGPRLEPVAVLYAGEQVELTPWRGLDRNPT